MQRVAALKAAGQYSAAAKEMAKVVNALAATAGPEHPSTLDAAVNLASIRHLQGRPESAGPLYAQALAGMASALGPEHPKTQRLQARNGNTLP
jgi:hypothetical protein